MDKNGACNASASGGKSAVRDGYVIFDNNIISLDAFHLRQFSGHLEIHNIAGVVFYDHQNALATVGDFDALYDAVRAGTGKHVA